MPNGLIAVMAIGLCCAAGIAAADTIYVSNEKDNTVTVLDGKTSRASQDDPSRPTPARHLALQGCEIPLHLRQR